MKKKLSLLLIPLLAFSLQAEEGKDLNDIINFVANTSLEGLFYLSYQYGQEGGKDYSRLYIYRAYLTVRKNLLSFMKARITFDTSQDKEGDGLGDMEVRLKYAYADFHLNDCFFLRKPHIEFGLVHAVWLDFEEHINLYRMREPMFLERSGVFNSADFGLIFAGDFGGQLPEEVKKEIVNKFAGKYGGFEMGLYNGGGYHAPENNLNKVAEARLSLRPLPTPLPGLLISTLAIYGKGNQPGSENQIPDWRTGAVMFSFQHSRGVFTAQYILGEGNQKGTWVKSADSSQALDFEGYSFFGELRLNEHWRSIAGYDYFKVEQNTEEFHRYYFGLGYDFGKENILLLDYTFTDNIINGAKDDYWIQLTQQIKF